MATIKSPASQYSLAALLLILIAVAVQMETVQSQNCASELNSLTTCAPFVLPGQPNTTPSPECCSALQNIEQGCVCSTLRIASQLPSACNLPPVTCGA